MQGGATIDGILIPEGSVVGVPHYTVHHNAAYYPEPFVFRPERWLAGAAAQSEKASGFYPIASATEEDVARASSAFCPFSIGPRGCIGKQVAYVEMANTLARVLFLYDLRKTTAGDDPSEGRPGLEYGRHRVEEFQLIDQFTSLKDGPMVEFRKRI